VAKQIQDIMTTHVRTVARATSIIAVARMMRDQRIGDVLVLDAGGTLCGIVTDRDIVVRVVADGRSADATTVGDICSETPVKIAPTASVGDAVQLMRERAIRRLPVVRDGVPVGIVSLGDLARHVDPGSVLAQISAAPASS
jgi:signal-transduction protein with cAMP-binding, CBS, and nucleotidyltransferase domain